MFDGKEGGKPGEALIGQRTPRGARLAGANLSFAGARKPISALFVEP